MTNRTKFKEGEIILLTSGSYSDYYVKGLFRVLKDFDATDYKLKYEGQSYYKPTYDWPKVVMAGLVVDIDHYELWNSG
jgi:hypothetical protein